MAQSAAIVGLGRIGLPLALSLAERGVDVIGVDKDRGRLDTVAAGRMPFEETGTQELLEKVLPEGRLRLTDSIADAAEADFIRRFAAPWTTCCRCCARARR
jgi:UDP-N-acetyl-D-mannosaminuronate dehydrogenase